MHSTKHMIISEIQTTKGNYKTCDSYYYTNIDGIDMINATSINWALTRISDIPNNWALTGISVIPNGVVTRIKVIQCHT